LLNLSSAFKHNRVVQSQTLNHSTTTTMCPCAAYVSPRLRQARKKRPLGYPTLAFFNMLVCDTNYAKWCKNWLVRRNPQKV